MQHPNRTLLAEVSFEELVPFLRPQLRPTRVWGLIYWAVNLAPVGWLTFVAWHEKISIDIFLTKAGQGVWLFLVLLPLHELIHAGAYKMIGAPKVSFGANLKKFYFYAVADQFMTSRKSFLFVALSPYLLITAGLVTAAALSSPPTRLLFLGAIILHTAGCFGDFALVSFMHQHRHQNIVTMDDLTEKKAYFFMVN